MSKSRNRKIRDQKRQSAWISRIRQIQRERDLAYDHSFHDRITKEKVCLYTSQQIQTIIRESLTPDEPFMLLNPVATDGLVLPIQAEFENWQTTQYLLTQSQSKY